MRNEKLKNELNNLLQDFDREQLWESIELPEKKRRRRGFYWIFIAGILLLGALLSLFLKQDADVKQQSSYTEHINVEEDIESAEIEIEDKSESINVPSVEKSNTANSDQDLEGSEKNVIDRQSLDNIEAKNLSDQSENRNKPTTLNINEDAAKKSIQESENLNHSQTRSIADVTKDKLKQKNESQTNIKTKNQSETIITKNPVLSNLENDIVSVEQIKPISGIALKAFVLKPRQLDFGHHFSITRSYHDRPYIYSLSIFGLVGNSNHDFKNAVHRQQIESPLETISFGVLGRMFMRNLEVFSGVSYSMNNTHLTTSVEESQYIDNFSNLVQKNISTTFSLYNSYQYLDFVLGLGYKIPLGQNWGITPSAQIGYTLDFKADGSVISDEGQLIVLSDLSGYSDYSKWQGQLNLKISRRLNRSWDIGFITYLSTRKTIGEFDDYSHSVSSYGAGISINRILNGRE